MTEIWDILIGLASLAALGIGWFLWLVVSDYITERRPLHRPPGTAPPAELPDAEDESMAIGGPEPMRGRRDWYWCGQCQGEPCWRCVRARTGR